MRIFCSLKKFFIWFELDSLSYFAQPKYWISVEHIISFRWIHRKSFNSVHSAKWDARSALIKRQMTSGSVKFHSIDNANASTLTTPLKFTTVGSKKPYWLLDEHLWDGFKRAPFLLKWQIRFYYCDKRAQIFNGYCHQLQLILKKMWAKQMMSWKHYKIQKTSLKFHYNYFSHLHNAKIVGGQNIRLWIVSTRTHFAALSNRFLTS